MNNIFCSQYLRSLLITMLLLLGIVSIPLCSLPAASSFNSYFVEKTRVDITLDYTQINGRIKSFAEINCGPLPNHNIHNGVDLTSQYQKTGFQYIRTHDFAGPTDISTIFPDMEANPFLESSYDFTMSDIYITSIIDTGCRVFYRLGESAFAEDKYRIPPENMSKWAEICKHIVMHYNNGWNNGYFYNISYWEIWNEPDLEGFWTGTAEDYYQLYEVTVLTLKMFNASLKVGGPCTSSIENVAYTTGFLQYVNDHELPLDFFSWHQYADTPYELYSSSVVVRDLLDVYGFSDCENINTEWNVNIFTPQREKDNVKNAAFTACSLTVFHDAFLDGAFRYRGTQDPSLLWRFLGLDLSLFSYDGLFKTPALSYLAMHYLFQDSPVRLATPTMDAFTGVTYLAGISEDNTNVSILISNCETTDLSYTLTVNNLPWNTSYSVIHYVIDESHHLEISEQETEISSTYTTVKTLEGSSVHFIRLTNSSFVPEEGPEVARIPFLLRLRILDPISRLLTILLFRFLLG